MIPHAQLFYQSAQAAEVSPYLLISIVEAESGFKEGAVSETGAKGPAQFTDSTWRDAWSRWGKLIAPDEERGDPFNPSHAIPLMAYYVRWLFKQTGYKWFATVVAYNWGISNVQEVQAAPLGILGAPTDKLRYAVNILERVLAYHEMLEGEWWRK